MDQFVGSHVNRLDAKGRISIPAPFRNVLSTTQTSASVMLRRSHLHACIDVWPMTMLDRGKARLAQMDMLDPDYEEMATRLFADTHVADPDKEGRIVVPTAYLRHARIIDTVTVSGRGAFFQFWEPGAAERRLSEVYAKPVGPHPRGSDGTEPRP